LVEFNYYRYKHPLTERWLHDTSELTLSLCKYCGWFCWKIFKIFL